MRKKFCFLVYSYALLHMFHILRIIHSLNGFIVLLEFVKDTKKPVSSVMVLLVCPIGTYKSTISNDDRCKQCPLNSHTKEKASSSCICNDEHFRLNSSIIDSPCIGK